VKRKGLIITTIIFFLTVNTNYFWEGKLGIFAFPAFLFLVVVYLVLVVGLVGQFFFAIREKFTNRQRLLSIAFLTIVLTLTYLFPSGLVSFDRLDGKDLFIAQREGAANCMTTFKLKENNKFIERSVCFGVTETKGDYILKDDTLFFTNVQLGRHEKEYYMFALIKLTGGKSEKRLGDLIRYKSYSDTTGHELWITKNDLTNDNDRQKTYR
jgi:hypothetical protein